MRKELTQHSDRHCLIPKLTFYETKKLMEGFVVTNVGDPTRPGWVTQLLGTHPSTLERIGMARASVG